MSAITEYYEHMIKHYNGSGTARILKLMKNSVQHKLMTHDEYRYLENKLKMKHEENNKINK